jgi:O-antigen/teichoic acid export membrane protein
MTGPGVSHDAGGGDPLQSDPPLMEKYFRTAGILGATEVLLRLKDLLLLPLITKHYGTADFGIWTQVRVMVAVLSPVVLLGIDKAALRFLPGQTPQEKRAGLGTLLAFILITSGAAAAVLVAFGPWISQVFFESRDHAPFVVLCGLVLMVTRAVAMLQNWFRIQDEGASYATVNLVRSAIAAGVVIAMVVLKMDMFALILCGTALEALLCLGLLWKVLREYSISWPRFDLVKTYVRYGLPLMPVGYAGWILNSSDRVFLVNLSAQGLRDVGIYSVLYLICFNVGATVVLPFRTMYQARASELYNAGDMTGLRTLFEYSTKSTLLFLCPVLGGISALAGPLITNLTTSEFVAGAEWMPAMAAGCGFYIMVGAWSISLTLGGKPWMLTAITALAAVANLILNYFLIPEWGGYGAAVATAISFALQLGLTIWAAVRQLPLPFNFPFLLKVVASTAAMGLLLTRLDPQGWSGLVGAICLGAIAYGAGVLLLRAMTGRELARLLEIARLSWMTRFRIVRYIVR